MKDDKNTIDRRAAFIGALLDGDAKCVPDADLLSWACRHGLGNMVYFYYHDKLPEPAASRMRHNYMSHAAADIKFTLAYAEIKKIFAAEKIDFVPLKGMAFVLQRVYSSGAMRPHCDIDMLFRSRSECYRAMESLKKHGWSVPLDKEWAQHIPPMVKNHIDIELHHYLPGMEKDELTDLVWSKYAVKHEDCEYRLPLELHFTIALTHCSIHHIWLGGAKFLLDAGMLNRMEGFDRNKCREICCEAGVNKVDNLFAAFPEIFGGNAVIGSQEEVLRKQFLTERLSLVALVVTEKDRFSAAWFRRYAERLSISWLRWKYNAQDAPWWRIVKLMWQDYTGKLSKICKFWSAKSQADERRRNDILANELLGISAETVNSRQFTSVED